MKFLVAMSFLSWHLVGVWIGGACNGHFQESKKKTVQIRSWSEEGEGVSEQGPIASYGASGVFLDPLEPQLEALKALIRGPISLRAFRGFVPISGTPSLFFEFEEFRARRHGAPYPQPFPRASFSGYF